jgi:hypothetical protein
MTSRAGFAEFARIMKVAVIPDRFDGSKQATGESLGLKIADYAIRAAVKQLEQSEPSRTGNFSPAKCRVPERELDAAIERSVISSMANSQPEWLSYAQSAVHLSERTLGFRVSARGQASWSTQRTRAGDCGTYSTPDFIMQSMMSDLHQLLPAPRTADVNILDQSLESGHFALGAMGILNCRRVSFFGIDRDPVAVAMARRFIKGFRRFAVGNNFQFQASARDSLLDPLPRSWPRLFHCIVGNPPWQATNSSMMGPIWKRYSPLLKGQFDAYLPFVLQAHSRVMPGGLICLVVPSSFLSNLSAEPVRRLLLHEYDILSLTLYPRRSFIEIPCLVPISFIARKRCASDDDSPRKTRIFYHPVALGGTKRPRFDTSELVVPIWRRTPGCVIHPLVKRETEFLLDNFDMPSLGSFGCLRGSRLGYRVGKTLSVPFSGFRARDVRAFHACHREVERFANGSRQFERPPDAADISRPKVAFKDVRCITLPTRLVAAGLASGEFGIASCSVFVPNNGSHNNFFVALFNSSFANAWYKLRDLSRAIRFWHLKELPVCFDAAVWASIGGLSMLSSKLWLRIHDQMGSCRERDEDEELRRNCPQMYRELTAVRREIDNSIFDLFEFSRSQRRAICRLSVSRAF